MQCLVLWGEKERLDTRRGQPPMYQISCQYSCRDSVAGSGWARRGRGSRQMALLLITLAGIFCIAPSARADVGSSALQWNLDTELTGDLGRLLDYGGGYYWGAKHGGDGHVWAYDGNETIIGGSRPAGHGNIGGLYHTDSGVFAVAVDASDPDQWQIAIEKSPDGFADFETVLTLGPAFDAGGKPFNVTQRRCFTDLGSGRLMYFQYANDPKVWYSDNAGEDWRVLMQASYGAVRHFHGAFYDAEKDTLYAMTGDAGKQCSIVFADDLWGPDGLVQNPDLWRQRWGMGNAPRSSMDPRYRLEVNGDPHGQPVRAVDMVIDGQYLYWGEDSEQEGGQHIYRADRVTHEVEEVGTGGISGEIRANLRTESGEVLFFASSYFLDREGHYYPSADEYSRIYALTPERDGFEEIARFRREDWQDPSGGAIWFTALEADGRIWLYNNNVELTDGAFAGYVASRPETLTWGGIDPGHWPRDNWNGGLVTPKGGEIMVVNSGRAVVLADMSAMPAISLAIANGHAAGTVDVAAPGVLRVLGLVSVAAGGTLSVDGVMTADRITVAGGTLTNNGTGLVGVRRLTISSGLVSAAQPITITEELTIGSEPVFSVIGGRFGIKGADLLNDPARELILQGGRLTIDSAGLPVDMPQTDIIVAYDTVLDLGAAGSATFDELIFGEGCVLTIMFDGDASLFFHSISGEGEFDGTVGEITITGLLFPGDTDRVLTIMEDPSPNTLARYALMLNALGYAPDAEGVTMAALDGAPYPISSPVPEPATLSLIALAALAVLRRRSR